MRAWRSAQRVRRGVESPLLDGSACPRIGALTKGEMPVSVISRLVMSKPTPSSKGHEDLRMIYRTGNGMVSRSGRTRIFPELGLRVSVISSGEVCLQSGETTLLASRRCEIQIHARCRSQNDLIMQRLQTCFG